MSGLSISSYSTVFAGRRKEYESGLPREEPRGDCRAGKATSVTSARAERLGFCRENPVELRKGGFLFMRQIDDTCICTLLSYRILFVFLPLPRLSRPIERRPVFRFHIAVL